MVDDLSPLTSMTKYSLISNVFPSIYIYIYIFFFSGMINHLELLVKHFKKSFLEISFLSLSNSYRVLQLKDTIWHSVAFLI